VRENRLVLPIPPGTHWSDAKPALLPEAVLEVSPLLSGEGLGVRAGRAEDDGSKANNAVATCPHPGPHPEGEGVKKPRAGGRKPKPKPAATGGPTKPAGGLWFAPPPGTPGTPGTPEPKAEKPKRVRLRMKNDPKLIAAARELRDRYLEQVNSEQLLPAAQGKYDVSCPRQLEAGAAPMSIQQTPLLKAA
jgi:hypothetical protein